jgi:hypothetical protein
MLRRSRLTVATTKINAAHRQMDQALLAGVEMNLFAWAGAGR